MEGKLYESNRERPTFRQVPNKKCTEIAELHAENGFNLKLTAARLNMKLGEFLKMIVESSNLRMAIAEQKRKHKCYLPYGEKRRDYKYEK